MNGPTRLLGFAAATAWIYLAACSQPAYTNYPPRDTGAWVALGDSLTSGVGAGRGEDYPAVLGSRLGMTIFNAGVPGNTSADGLARVEAVISLEPSVVLLCLGGNDGLRQVPLAETVANLSAVIQRLQQAGAFVVLIGVRSASLIDQYHGPFKELAAEKNTLYLPNILDGVLGKTDLMADRIHPNAAGYRQIAERLANDLREAGVIVAR